MSGAIETTGEVMKAAPPVAVTGMTVFGVEVSDVVLIVTLIYTVLQIVLLLPKYWQWALKLRRKE